MAYSFPGGIHPHDHKVATKDKAIETPGVPEQVTIPVSMHIGAPATPIVKKGDVVDMGQKIAEAAGFVSTPVHASISGTVTAVAPMLHPNGTEVMSIVIENDFEDRLHESVKPLDFEAMTNDERVEAIKNAGIVGHGGATFPTHVKISSGIGKVDTVIINGAECEPFITSDHRILLEDPTSVVEGTKLLAKILGVEKALIGIEVNKSNTFPAIEKLIANDSVLTLCPLKCKYPQGAEKQLINALTGREVPSAKLPADAGCAVFNVDTAAAVYRLFTTGMPVVRRIVTVSGSAIADPKNLSVRVGTPIRNLVDYCGGFKEAPNKLLFGGPMMGVAQFSVDLPVIKGTNAFLALSGTEDIREKDPTCIRCGRCVNACPMHLLPSYLNLYASHNRFEEAADLGMLDCIECGSCSYECPARIPLVQQFRVAKQRILESRQAKK